MKTPLLLRCLAVAAALLPFLAAQPCTPGQNASLAFDGVDDWVRIADDPALDGFADFTVELWVRTGSGTNQGLVSKFRHSSGTDTDDAFSLRLWPPGVLRVQLASGSSSSGVRDGATIVTPGVWHHVALTRTGSTVQAYVDGQPDFSFTFAGTLNDTAAALVLGCVQDGNDAPEVFLGGSLDEVRIWNVARSQAEIQLAMGVGLGGSEAGLAGYWRLDDGAGQTVASALLSGVAGTLGPALVAEAADPTWSPYLPSPLVYCGLGTGQANGPAATLLVNGVGLAPAAGPFLVPVPSGGTLAFAWSGAPGVPLALAIGGENGGLPVPPFGSLDVGTPPLFADLFVLFDGFQAPYGLFFSTGPGGAAQQTFTLPALPPGTIATVQGVMGQPPGGPGPGIVLTAAHRIVVL